MKDYNKTLLVILDGWGIGKKDKADAIHNGETPYWDSLIKKYPNSQLEASGLSVGLPKGVMGNSEVGHMNIGAGRVIFQDLVRINNDIETGEFKHKQAIADTFTYAKKTNKAIHFVGLVSDGGIHSMNTHLYKLCDIAKQYELDKVYIHAITDGRDTDPRSGLGFIEELQDKLDKTTGKIASITGRYYTMDRDNRWERVKRGYDAMIHGIGKQYNDIFHGIRKSYDRNITDEFIKPIIHIDKNNKAIGKIKKDDIVFFINYRNDRVRQIVSALTQKNIPEYGMETLELYLVTMTCYDSRFEKINTVYTKNLIKNTIGEVVSRKGLKQLRIAETEKFPHVTFFFSGGKQNEFFGEKRILIPSSKVATYDLQPEMSAIQISEILKGELRKQEHHFICLNFANGDMVGHTGIYEAILKAIKTIDNSLKEVVETAKENNYSIIIISDHGNADNVINADGSPNTAHSTNPVPCIIIPNEELSNKYPKLEIKNGRLADVSPTLCNMLNIEIPEDMDGNGLIKQ